MQCFRFHGQLRQTGWPTPARRAYLKQGALAEWTKLAGDRRRTRLNMNNSMRESVELKNGATERPGGRRSALE